MSNKGKFLRFGFGGWLGLLLFLASLFIFPPLQAQTQRQTEPPEKKEQAKKERAKFPAKKQDETKPPQKKKQAKQPVRTQEETKTREKKEQTKQEHTKPPAKKQAEIKTPEKRKQIKPPAEKQAEVKTPPAPKVEEIIKISKLTKANQKFTIKRNIFSPDVMKPDVPIKAPSLREMLPPEQNPEDNKAENPNKGVFEEEIRNNLFYEGYVVKNSKNIALVTLNGEFYAVGEGDMVEEKITIIKIEKETITVEFDDNVLEIPLKGDDKNA